jgi:DNA-binding transcriptional LysR family regulator
MDNRQRSLPKPPMNSLRAFVAAAQNNSFVAAGAILNVTPAAISRHIKILEDTIGHKLFIRHAQGVELTDFGRLWLPSVSDAFNLIDSSLKYVRRNLDQRPMRIICQTAFATGWLLPRLEEFLNAHPDIDLRLYALNDVAVEDIQEKSASGAILSGSGQWSGLDGHFLLANRFMPVCSPDYRDKHPSIHSATDLLTHRLIVPETAETLWKSWFEHQGAHYASSHLRLYFATAFLPVKAACMGLGIALADLTLISRELQEGELLPVLNTPSITPGTGWYLINSPSQRRDVQYQRWSNWLREQADRHEASSPSCDRD